MKPHRVIAMAAVVAVSGCAALLGIDDGSPREGGTDATFDVVLDLNVVDASVDAADAGVQFCDTDAAFTAPVAFTKLDTTLQEAHGRLSPNEFTIFYQSVRDGGLGSTDLYFATRTSIGNTWTGITTLGAGVNSAASESDCTASGDLLTLFFSRNNEIYISKRASTAAAFGAASLLTTVNSAAADFGPYVRPDGMRLYLSSARASDAGVSSIYSADLGGDGGFATPTLVNGPNGKGDNRFSAITSDELVMYFSSDRPTTQGGHDIWLAERTSTGNPFGTPRIIAEVSSTFEDHADWISDDRCRLYFSSNRNAGADYDLFVATKTP